MSKPTLKKIEAELSRMDPSMKRDSDEWRAGLTLLAGLVVGANIVRVAKFARLPRAKVAEFSARLRKAGVWRGGKTACEWFEKDGGIAFFLDVGVATGMFNRVPEATR